MRKLSFTPVVLLWAAASCVRQEQTPIVERGMDQAKTSIQAGVPSLTPPQGLDDEWSRWLIGEWESTAESDLPDFKCWVQGKGQVKAELGVGGQFLIVTKRGEVAQISDDYLQHLRRNMYAPEDEIEKLRKMKFAEVDFRTIDPRTGRLVVYLFDSWRCVATGTGTCDGKTEIIEWKWSAGGQGTSVRTTQRVNADKFIVIEKYTLPDGGTMEDRAQMIRKR